jgi:hypothetical protein
MTETETATLYCTFCGQSQHEVRKLIAGPGVFICDECVELSMDIIHLNKVDGEAEYLSWFDNATLVHAKPTDQPSVPHLARLELPLVNRVEVIDHSPKGTGRDWAKRDLRDVMLLLQDDGATLKVFVR